MYVYNPSLVRQIHLTLYASKLSDIAGLLIIEAYMGDIVLDVTEYVYASRYRCNRLKVDSLALAMFHGWIAGSRHPPCIIIAPDGVVHNAQPVPAGGPALKLSKDAIPTVMGGYEEIMARQCCLSMVRRHFDFPEETAMPYAASVRERRRELKAMLEYPGNVRGVTVNVFNEGSNPLLKLTCRILTAVVHQLYCPCAGKMHMFTKQSRIFMANDGLAVR
jgi:hypothetical protein